MPSNSPQAELGHSLMAVQLHCPRKNQPGSWVSPRPVAQRRRPQDLTPSRGSALSTPRQDMLDTCLPLTVAGADREVSALRLGRQVPAGGQDAVRVEAALQAAH